MFVSLFVCKRITFSLSVNSSTIYLPRPMKVVGVSPDREKGISDLNRLERKQDIKSEQ